MKHFPIVTWLPWPFILRGEETFVKANWQGKAFLATEKTESWVIVWCPWADSITGQNVPNHESQITCLLHFSPLFKLRFHSKQARGWLSLAARHSQDGNLRRIRRLTSRRQNPNVVLLLLAKCLGSPLRRGRGRAQLCKQPLTYSPLMLTKPRPGRFKLGLFGVR